MNRHTMMDKISQTLKEGEVITISVTNARGRTLNHHYNVSSNGYEYSHRSWGGLGTLRDEYKTRVLGQ